jgi:hypothetical protein
MTTPGGGGEAGAGTGVVGLGVAGLQQSSRINSTRKQRDCHVR